MDKWQSLTDDEIRKIMQKMFESGHFSSYNPIMFAKEIEKVLKEKNGC